MKNNLHERTLIIDFLTKVSKSASQNCEDEANVLIDIFVIAMQFLSPIEKQNILQKIATDYRITAPILYEVEDQELPF